MRPVFGGCVPIEGLPLVLRLGLALDELSSHTLLVHFSSVFSLSQTQFNMLRANHLLSPIRVHHIQPPQVHTSINPDDRDFIVITTLHNLIDSKGFIRQQNENIQILDC